MDAAEAVEMLIEAEELFREGLEGRGRLIINRVIRDLQVPEEPTEEDIRKEQEDFEVWKSETRS